MKAGTGYICVGAIVSISLLGAACSDFADVTGPIDVAAQLRDWVEPSLLATATTVLVEEPRLDESHSITSDEAKDLAVVYFSHFAPSVVSYFERSLGVPLDLSGVEPAPRVYLATSPHVLPASSPLRLRKAYGPVYIVQLQQSDAVFASVAVSAFNTDLQIIDGRLRSDGPGTGADFLAIPVHPDLRSVPISPEAAIVITGEATGRRTVSPPRLIRPTIPGRAPQRARWELQLEAPVRAITDAGTLSVDRIYVDEHGNLLIADPSQPDEWPASPGLGEGGEALDVTVERRGDVPVRFLGARGFSHR